MFYELPNKRLNYFKLFVLGLLLIAGLLFSQIEAAAGDTPAVEGVTEEDTPAVEGATEEDTPAVDELPEVPEHFDISPDFDPREITPRFGPGERLRWRVTYLGLTAGELRVQVDEDDFNGQDVFKLTLEAESKGMASWLYSVSDRAVSFMDVGGLFSWGYDYFQDHEDEEDEERVRYYQDKGFFMHDDGERGEIPPYTQDALSAVFFLRSQELEVGNEYSFPVQVGDEVAQIYLDVTDIVDVRTCDGWEKAYLVGVGLERKTGDLDEEGEEVTDRVENIRFWLSKDERQIPYQIAVSAYFGSIYAYLEDYEPGEEY